MAASRFVEEESGFYTGQIRHPHNGYYAGDFSQTARFATEPWGISAERPSVPHAWQRSHADRPKASVVTRGQHVASGTAGAIPAI